MSFLFPMPKWCFLLTVTSILPVSSWQDPVANRRSTNRNIEELAIIRPFSMLNIEALSHAFEEWGAFLPCDISKRTKANGRAPVLVDVFLSYSQTYENFKPARDYVRRVIDGFAANYNASGWEQCINRIIPIEANIDPQVDLYAVNEAHINRMWVHGPNQQFVYDMNKISGGEFGHYDAVFVMENDVLPVRQYWLDSLLEEAERYPFMILGSKYDGDSWDEFRSSLPLSLQHHINGNAVYNITHPLMKKLITQMELEEDTPYHAVPYDYRISQILVEGMLGIVPEVAPDIVKNWSNNNELKLENNTKKFRAWWAKYSKKSGETRSAIIRESQIIANYAGTNLLPRHTKSIKASLVHGAIQYASWDSVKYTITLVISEWHDGLASNLLSKIDASTHPFSKVILMVPHNMASHDINRLSSIQTNINVSIQKRNENFMDICNARVDTEYFMITNSYHVVSPQVDLLFTKDSRRLPVIPFTQADQGDCLEFQPCVEAYQKSKQFDKQSTILVQDFDMLFKTDLRDEFCSVWRKRYQKESVHVEDVGTPTATTYTSFLSMRGILGKFYDFTDRSIFGKRDNFRRFISIDEERSATYGETVLSNYIMKEDAVKSDKMTSFKIRRRRYLQLVPTLIPPDMDDDTETGLSPSSNEVRPSMIGDDPSMEQSVIPSLEPSLDRSSEPSSEIPLIIDLSPQSGSADPDLVDEGFPTAPTFDQTPTNKAYSSKIIIFSLGEASHIVCSILSFVIFE